MILKAAFATIMCHCLASAQQITRVDPGSDCWYDLEHQCDTAGNVFDGTDESAENAMACYANIPAFNDANENIVKHFRWLKLGPKFHCFYLKDCTPEEYSGTADTSVSGPADCDSALEPCSRLNKPEGNELEWDCPSTGVDPYVADIPFNTTCLASCTNWVNSNGVNVIAYSTCNQENAGEKSSWSEVTYSDNLPPLENEANKPSEPTICPDFECRDTFELWHNPNLEPGTFFFCDLTPPSAISAANATNILTIPGDDQCYLKCDEFLVAKFKCFKSGWENLRKDIGISCYRDAPPYPSTRTEL